MSTTWLTKWEPENEQFWESEGQKHATRTLWVTTFSLIFSFATWFVMSAVSVKLPGIGFKFDTMQLFWLAAMPGLAGGTFRLIHTFLIPIYGTRHVITVATFLKIIPMLWLGFAVQDPTTPYSHFLIISILCGFGGGDFSSFMPSTSLHFPKKQQGVAMGIQAGIGNFGVSLTQFITPWIIGFALFGATGGASQVFLKADKIKEVKVVKENNIVKDIVVNEPKLAEVLAISKTNNIISDVTVNSSSELAQSIKVDVKKNDSGVITDIEIKKVTKKNMWLQNAAFWYIPLLAIMGIICWIYLRSIKVPRTSIGTMLKNMTDNKHAWFCVITYVMTFGSFSGFAAAFPLMIKIIYGGFENAPDPLKYAFYGPLIGSAVRALFGAPSDKWGGSIWLMVSGIGLIIGTAAMIFGGYLTPTSLDQFPGFVGIMLFLFLMAGIGNAATFRQYPIVFAFSRRQGAQILGWTGAWAAYGPFLFSSLIGASITAYGNANAFFWGALVFFIIATVINWYFYTRKNAERYDFGAKGGTWWDKAKATWTGPVE